VKTKLFILIASILATTLANAQENKSISVMEVMQEESAFASRGFRVGYFKPTLSWEVTNDGYHRGGGYFNEDMNGVNVGYVYIPGEGFGWLISAALIDVNVSSVHPTLLRGEGDVTYSFNRFIYTKLGLNASKWTQGLGVDRYDANAGAQAGLGLQVNKFIGFDLNAVTMRQTREGQTLLLSGLEFGVNGTF
jgi:hypothetical protein